MSLGARDSAARIIIIYHCQRRAYIYRVTAAVVHYIIILRYTATATKRRGAAVVVAGTHVKWRTAAVAATTATTWVAAVVVSAGGEHMGCARVASNTCWGLGRLLPSRRGEVNGPAKLQQRYPRRLPPLQRPSIRYALRVCTNYTCRDALDDPVFGYTLCRRLRRLTGFTAAVSHAD